MLIHPGINNWRACGRIGNQFFQVASVIGISRDNGIDFGFTQNWNYLQYFDFTLPLTDIDTGTRIHDPQPYYHYEKVHLNPRENYIVEGYFQSEKYFESVSDEIRGKFTLNSEIESQIKELFKDKLDRVAIHVRRGDFVGNGCTIPLTMDYYVEAFTHFPENNFLLCSDDIPWCKQQEVFQNKDIHFIENTHPDIYDMYLMSYCKPGIIMANSSFSWWSAWLGEKEGFKIIAPKAWFGGWLSADHLPIRWKRVGNPFWLEFSD